MRFFPLWGIFSLLNTDFYMVSLVLQSVALKFYLARTPPNLKAGFARLVLTNGEKTTFVPGFPDPPEIPFGFALFHVVVIAGKPSITQINFTQSLTLN